MPSEAEDRLKKRIRGRSDDLKNNQRDAVLLSLKMEERGREPRNVGFLKLSRKKEWILPQNLQKKPSPVKCHDFSLMSRQALCLLNYEIIYVVISHYICGNLSWQHRKLLYHIWEEEKKTLWANGTAKQRDGGAYPYLFRESAVGQVWFGASFGRTLSTIPESGL